MTGVEVLTDTPATLLRNPYYVGTIVYEGEEYPARHEAIIDRELFDRVQDVLEARRIAGERQRRHHHPLKGSLWCGACHRDGRHRRMILQRAKGTGGVYYYFFCRGRQQHECDESYLSIDRVERAVIVFYRRIL